MKSRSYSARSGATTRLTYCSAFGLGAYSHPSVTLPTEDQTIVSQQSNWTATPFMSHDVHQQNQPSDGASSSQLSSYIDLTVETSSDEEDSDVNAETEIGSVLKNGRFKCRENVCGRKSFARPAELRRHFKSKHTPKKRNFWCWVASCSRSRGVEHRPFNRKDKLMAYARSMHDFESVVDPGNDGLHV
jgi:hypothetical protein